MGVSPFLEEKVKLENLTSSIQGSQKLSTFAAVLQAHVDLTDSVSQEFPEFLFLSELVHLYL
jgi:hypothetical protein